MREEEEEEEQTRHTMKRKGKRKTGKEHWMPFYLAKEEERLNGLE